MPTAGCATATISGGDVSSTSVGSQSVQRLSAVTADITERPSGPDLNPEECTADARPDDVAAAVLASTSWSRIIR